MDERTGRREHGRGRLAPTAVRVVAATVTFGLALAAGLALLRPRPPGETVALVETPPRLGELLEARARSGPRPEPAGPGLVREEVSEEVAALLAQTLAAGRKTVYDPLTYFRNRPNQDKRWEFPEHPQGVLRFVTNSHGFRDDEEVAAESPDLRVLVTGDSHAEGVVPNDESFANVLEALLAADGRGAVEVLNAACGGYTFYSYLGVLERHQELAPQVFVVAVYGGNDFQGVLPWYRWFHRLGPGPSDPELVRRRDLAREASIPAVAQALGQAAYFESYPAEVELALAAAEEVTVEIDRLCRERGVRLVVVHLPPMAAVQPWIDPDGLRSVAEAYELDEDDLARLDAPGRRYVERLGELGIEHLDLSAPFAAADEPLYWRSDHHLSTAGHRFVARVLFDHLDAE